MAALHTTVLLAGAALLAAPPAATPALPSAVRWSVAVASSPAAPPVVDGDRIFVVLQSGVVAAHRVSDGAEAWHVALRSDQPVAVDGALAFVAAGDAIHALKAIDGSVAWRAPSGPVTAPLLARTGWLIATSATGLTAFRAADGTRVWSRETGAAHVPPAIEGDNLYAPLDDGRLLALDLQTGKTRWARHFRGAASEVLALPDRIYVGSADTFFYCLDAADGAREWRARIGAVLRGGPVADDRRVFVTSMDNTLRAYDRDSGALLWHPNVPFRPTAGPVLVGPDVVVPGNAVELRAFDAGTGKAAGTITLGEPLAMPPGFGRSGEVMLMAAFTGNLKDQWKLVLAAPPPAEPPAPPG